MNNAAAAGNRDEVRRDVSLGLRLTGVATVAAAVVLVEGIAPASERELRDFCAAKLAHFKVPRKVVLLTEIPKGATGKLQRIGLAQKLGLGS